MAEVAKKYKADTVRAAFSKWFVGEETDGEQRAFCPICEDPYRSKSPSAMMNPDQGVWNCLKNNHGGSIAALVADLKKETGFNIRSEAMKFKNSNDDKFTTARDAGLTAAGRKAAPLPTSRQVSGWNRALLLNKQRLEAFTTARMIDKDTIRARKIGWDGQRYTIPVYDLGGELLNVRRYDMGGSYDYKMVNIAGHGTVRLYCEDVLDANDVVVLTEGETDCLLLNQHGIPAVTHTGGARTFKNTWVPSFAGKTVYVCFDNDDTGRLGAEKIVKLLGRVAQVFVMEIPVDKKGADVTDFFALGKTVEDFRELMKSAEIGKGGKVISAEATPTSGRKVSLLESMSQDLQNEAMELHVSIAGKQSEPYTAPKKIIANCDVSKGAACQNCPISFKNGELEVELSPNSEDVFRFVDVSEQRRKTLLKEVTGARCTDRVDFETTEDWHIEELMVQPSVDERVDDQTETPIKRTIFSVGTYRSKTNEKVRLLGQNLPDPKTGKLRFVAWDNKQMEMDIDKFEMTEELRSRLRKFRPDYRKGEKPLDKMFEIAADLSENVTGIKGRDMLHVFYDIVWHSVQAFRVNDQIVEKGWVEAGVVGDTRTGKSEIANKLIRHYQAGELKSCEGATFAGIVGGVQQIDGRWHMTWGVVPMNDRRLVVLDEVSGLADMNVIEQMSSIRSSGVAQITKIQTEQASARTRLLWIFNPADGQDLSSNSGAGMWGIRSVFKNNEDIARFDMVTAVSRQDVDTDIINSGFQEMAQPFYTSEDCELLVKWAWSLGRNDVIISDAAIKAAVESSKGLGRRYLPEPPFIQAENVRFKVLRIAAAIAARLFSCNKQGKLVVNKEHVEAAEQFIDMIYEQDSIGYARDSRRKIAATERANERSEACRAFLQERSDDVLLTLKMVGGNKFRTRDFVDFAGMDAQVAQQVVRKFLDWRMVHLSGRGDVKMDPQLVKILREFEDREYEED